MKFATQIFPLLNLHLFKVRDLNISKVKDKAASIVLAYLKELCISHMKILFINFFLIKLKILFYKSNTLLPGIVCRVQIMSL